MGSREERLWNVDGEFGSIRAGSLFFIFGSSKVKGASSILAWVSVFLIGADQ
jgi:hypothetical protein